MVSLKILDLLKASKVFRGLSDDDLRKIAEKGQLRCYEPNETIIREGQTDHALFIIVRGGVEALLPESSADGRTERSTRIRLGRLKFGDCVGEYSLIDGLPASASVVAVEPTDLFEISRAGFVEIIDTGDHLARHIYENMLRLMIARARQRNKELDLCY